jgi:hypothetical protein
MYTVEDWNKGLEIPLASALAMSIEITGMAGRNACKRAIILMAESARKMTKIAPKNRKVVKNPEFEHLLTRKQYREMGIVAGKPIHPMHAKYFKYTATKQRPNKSPYQLYANNPEEIKRIKNRGLAKKSWFWGLNSFGKKSEDEIPGVSELHEMIGKDTCGFILDNKLSYVIKAMPGGWEQMVQKKASDQIMATAAKTLERKLGVHYERLDKHRRKPKGLDAAWRAAK